MLALPGTLSPAGPAADPDCELEDLGECLLYLHSFLSPLCTVPGLHGDMYLHVSLSSQLPSVTTLSSCTDKAALGATFQGSMEDLRVEVSLPFSPPLCVIL